MSGLSLKKVIAEMKKLNPEKDKKYWKWYEGELKKISEKADKIQQCIGIDHRIIAYCDGTFGFCQPLILGGWAKPLVK